MEAAALARCIDRESSLLSLVTMRHPLPRYQAVHGHMARFYLRMGGERTVLIEIAALYSQFTNSREVRCLFLLGKSVLSLMPNN